MKSISKFVQTGVLTLTLSTVGIYAQTIEEGKKMFAYEKYQSAKQIFEKNANDPIGTYWLGQTLLRLKQPKEQVRSLYQNALSTNPKSDLLKIGLTHIDVLDGNIAKAKNSQAELLNKSKDIELYNATARAQLASKAGDVDFLLEKLQYASTVNKKKNIDLPLLLAKVFLRKSNTSDATYAYVTASDFDPNNAEVIYHRAKMYNPKLDAQSELRHTEFLNKTIQKDPNYAPAYYDLFYLNYTKDKNKALEYFNKYKNLADKTTELEYIDANVSYNVGNYENAIKLSQTVVVRDGEKTDARFYKVLAHSYLDTNNLQEASKYLTLYLSKVNKEDINYGDYIEAGKIASKLNDEPTAISMFDNAIKLAENNGERYNVAQVALPIYKAKYEVNKADVTLATPFRVELAKWLEVNYKNHHNPTNVDLYNFGLENFSLKNWEKTNEAFEMYKTKYPDQVQGFYFVGVANSKTALNNIPVATENFTKAVEVGMVSIADNKYFVTQSLLALAEIARENKDITKVKEYANQILSYDATNAQANALLKLK
jgi:predicted Zn-dependent protease